MLNHKIHSEIVFKSLEKRQFSSDDLGQDGETNYNLFITRIHKVD